MPIKQRPAQLAPQRRHVVLRLVADGSERAATVDLVARTVTLTFATDAPVDMWYGTEILSMAPGAMRTGVRQDSMPLLFNHDMDDLLGVVESVGIVEGRGQATVRFGKDPRGEWAMQQAADGILVNVSFLYRVFVWEEDIENDTLTATDWEPYEVSLVTVPADPNAGVGRSADACTQNDVQITTRQRAAAVPVPASTTQSNHTTTTEEPAMRFRTQSHRLQEQADTTTSTGAGAVEGSRVTNGHTPEAQRALQQQGAAAERSRLTEIHAIARKYGLSDAVRDGLIDKGATVEEARTAAADLVLQRSTAATPAADMGGTVNPDLTDKEKARYSMIRAVNAALSGDWSSAGFERECSQAIEKARGGKKQHERSFYLPTNLQFARAAYAVGTSGTGTTGGTLVATNLLSGSFIEVLRNQSRVLSLGATLLSGLVGNVDIPRQTGQSTAYWTTEGTSTTESEATFDKVSLSMKTVGTYSQISRNMLMQSTPDIDMIVRADLMAVVALALDLAGLSGAGTGGVPLGIANTSGIGSVVGGTNGAQLSIDNLIDLETQLASSNAPETSLAYLANAKSVGWMKKLKSTTGQYLWTNSPNGQRSGTPGEINGYSVARSNQARSNLTKGTASGICSEVFFGAWSELLIGEWGVMEIVPNPYDAAVYKSGGVLLRVLQSVDVAVRHAASFAVMSDALTA